MKIKREYICKTSTVPGTKNSGVGGRHGGAAT